MEYTRSLFSKYEVGSLKWKKVGNNALLFSAVQKITNMPVGVKVYATKAYKDPKHIDQTQETLSPPKSHPRVEELRKEIRPGRFIDPNDIEIYIKEAKIMMEIMKRKFSSIPVAMVFEVFKEEHKIQDEDSYFTLIAIVMEPFDCSLRDLVEDNKLSDPERYSILFQLCKILPKIHRAGFEPGDLHQDNILCRTGNGNITKHRGVVLCDFGQYVGKEEKKKKDYESFSRLVGKIGGGEGFRKMSEVFWEKAKEYGGGEKVEEGKEKRIGFYEFSREMIKKESGDRCIGVYDREIKIEIKELRNDLEKFKKEQQEGLEYTRNVMEVNFNKELEKFKKFMKEKVDKMFENHVKDVKEMFKVEMEKIRKERNEDDEKNGSGNTMSQ